MFKQSKQLSDYGEGVGGKGKERYSVERVAAGPSPGLACKTCTVAYYIGKINEVFILEKTPKHTN